MKLSLTAPAVFLLACLCTITYSTEAIILDSNVTAAVTASDYSAALGMSYLFYEAQRSGKLPPTNRIPWRGNTFLSDCVVGGYFDAGDHLKLMFPMGTSMAFLGLAIIQFEDAIKSSGQLSYAQDTLRWGADFLMEAHTAPKSFVGQIGDPGIDHAYWGRPEDQGGSRPCFTWDMSTQPASDLASAAASALAATSMVFGSIDPGYADKAMGHAKELYAAAAANEGKYSSSYTSVTYVYSSSTFRDDLALAATMLWLATGDATYLNDAIAQRAKPDFLVQPYVNWDAVGPVSAILLYCKGKAPAEALSQVEKFRTTWENCDTDGFQKTPEGLCVPPLGGWANLRHATSAAFAMLMYANCETDSTRRSNALSWAKSQVDYALGSTGRSFVVGFGNSPPTHEHHRGASCPNEPAPCGWDQFNTPNSNPQILTGALVGGPAGPGDGYTDIRSNYQQNEVALDYNAGFTGALAGLLHMQNTPSLAVPVVSTSPSPSNTPTAPSSQSPSGSVCDDIPPDNKYSCAQQAGWGKCNQPWMAGSVCRKSCGRC